MCLSTYIENVLLCSLIECRSQSRCCALLCCSVRRPSTDHRAGCLRVSTARGRRAWFSGKIHYRRAAPPYGGSFPVLQSRDTARESTGIIRKISELGGMRATHSWTMSCDLTLSSTWSEDTRWGTNARQERRRTSSATSRMSHISKHCAHRNISFVTNLHIYT
jgi:hypothetical protein